MTESYPTEEQKLVKFEFPPFTLEESLTVHEIFRDKGYDINVVSRLGSDGRMHDAFHVERKDVPQLVEQFFRQRIAAEYQAEGKGKASIINCYDYSSETLISAIKRFHKNKEA